MKTTIILKDNSFNPARAYIFTGDTVVWQNEDTKKHEIDFWMDIPEVVLQPTQSHSMDFADPGEFSYHCPDEIGMDGTIHVEESDEYKMMTGEF